MASSLNKALRTGLGIRGLIGALVLGSICLFQPMVNQKRYVPWWYAGACVYVDLAAVALLVFKG